ncbi:hypothetical protein L1049_008293 [Liquidambar formosana]|uniref:Sorting nexin C-terminal domain-containing protein n=1 Tax=Liquidambar formosana TaxID=63359 RepID=A0AAP0S685_LIQFO
MLKGTFVEGIKEEVVLSPAHALSLIAAGEVNVDDAVDDIVRQFKGVSDGLMRKVVGTSPYEASPSISGRNWSWHADELSKHVSRLNNTETTNSFSDNEEGDKDRNHGHEEGESVAQANGWHSDNELNSKGFPPRVIKCDEEFRSFDSEKKQVKPEWIDPGGYPAANFPVASALLEDPVGMLPEWSPPNVSVPVLNLVDKIFQLKRRGWLRRQVFWISKQILQLMMEDAIDDWLLRQIHWLRRDDIIAQGIRWVQDVLWLDGKFFLRLTNTQSEIDDTPLNQRTLQTTSHIVGSNLSKAGVSFQLQLEAARRASDVKKMIFGELILSLQ